MKILKKIKKLLRFKKEPLKKLFFTKDILKGENFTIGNYTYGNPKILFPNDTTKLVIGNFTSIANNVTIMLGGNHRTDWITTYPFNALKKSFPEASTIIGHPATKGDVIIGSDVWIGQDAFILSGVKIAHGAVVGARSVVAKDIGPYEIWAGNPAKFIKKRFDDISIEQLLKLNWWEKDIVLIKEIIPDLCSTDISSLINKFNKDV